MDGGIYASPIFICSDDFAKIKGKLFTERTSLFQLQELLVNSFVTVLHWKPSSNEIYVFRCFCWFFLGTKNNASLFILQKIWDVIS